jgi:hypothetical protein
MGDRKPFRERTLSVWNKVRPRSESEPATHRLQGRRATFQADKAGLVVLFQQNRKTYLGLLTQEIKNGHLLTLRETK